MLGNHDKYRAFATALRDIVVGKKVLDVGTGSGVLALICVALGADHVTAIERPPLQTITSDVLSRYNLNGRLTLLLGDVFDQTINIEPHDVILSETIGYLGFEENILPILSCAVERYGHSKCRYLPSNISVNISPAFLTSGHGEEPYLTFDAASNKGFQWESMQSPIDLGRQRYKGVITAESKWRVDESIALQGVHVFFEAILGNDIKISNVDNIWWPHCVVPFAKELALRKGDVVTSRLILKSSNALYYDVLIRCTNLSNGSFIDRQFRSTDIQSGAIAQRVPQGTTIATMVDEVLRSIGLSDRLVFGK